MTRDLALFAVGSPYAWDVVESARRHGTRVRCIDNLGSADETLPDLVRLEESTPRGPFTVGLASAEHRRRAAHAAYDAGFDDPVELVDPTAVLASTATLGHGVYVNAAGVVASHATIGCHTNVNRSSSVGHHCTLGFAVSTGPGLVLAGAVRVGDGAFLGAGATVLPEVSIGRGAVVGAGAVVTRDVEEYAVVVGNPARTVKHRDRPTADAERLERCPHC